MNQKLVKTLSERWLKPGGQPGKGAILVDGCDPCAQSEAIMEAKNIGKLDLVALLTSNHNNLDTLAAEVLGISVSHAILLRRFNDSSSLSPSLVLQDLEQVLGPNWKKVLQFWFYLDSLSDEDWQKVIDNPLIQDLSGFGPTDELPELWRSNRSKVEQLAEKLNLITPDIVSELTTVNQFKSRSYCWKATWDYCITRGVSDKKQIIPSLVAYAAVEVQCSTEFDGLGDLYFCNLLDYNPFKAYRVRELQTKLKNLANKTKKLVNRVKAQVDSKVFLFFKGSKETASKTSKFRFNPEVEVEGMLTYSNGAWNTPVNLVVNEIYLSLNDLTSEEVLREVEMMIRKTKEHANTSIIVPVLGRDTKQEKYLETLLNKFRTTNTVAAFSRTGTESNRTRIAGSEWIVMRDNTSRWFLPKGSKQPQLVGP